MYDLVAKNPGVVFFSAALALACAVDEGPKEEQLFVRSPLARTENPRPDPLTLEQTVVGNTDFAFEIYRQLPDSNLVLSPFSISLAMAMAWAGASGESERTIARVFHFGEQAATHEAFNYIDQQLGVAQEKLTVRLANAVWIHDEYTPRQPYLDTLAVHYGAGVGIVDFQNDRAGVIEAIDDWVAGKTEQKIPDLLKDVNLPAIVEAILVNAAYFKASWIAAFEKHATRDDRFTKLDGTQASIMMMQNSLELPYAEALDYQAAAVPFETVDGRTYEFVVVLPKNDFLEFDLALDGGKIREIVGSLSARPVWLQLPRFELRSKLELREQLEALGLLPLPRFDEMTEPLLKGGLEKVVHESFIAIDEAGAEAAAATAVIIARDSSSDTDFVPPISLRLDKPFVCLIRHRQSGTILFLGRFLGPN